MFADRRSVDAPPPYGRCKTGSVDVIP